MTSIKIRKEPPSGTVWEPLNASILQWAASNACDIEVRDLPIEFEMTTLDGCQLSVDGRLSKQVLGKSFACNPKTGHVKLVVAVLLQ